jgi:peptidoglycan/xylan/chitin deacetylase (PgdA/CDA1 family)
MWASIRLRRASRPAAIAGALAVLVGIFSVVTLGAVRGLPVPRLPASAVIHLHLQLGPQASSRHAPVRVEVGAQPASPPSAEPTPVRPQAVIPPGLSSVRVPILEYHYVRVNPNPRDGLGFNLSVTPASFQSQMDWLAAHRYHPIALADLRAYFAGQVDLPARPVVLTFDDGYRDFYSTAWPVLRAHGFKAVSYVVPGFLGGKSYMTPDQVAQLDRAGIEIGSHTVHHVDLTKVDPITLRIELEASRGYLEQLLGHPVLDFCYPSGRFNEAVEAAVAAAGYQSATTEVPGTAQSWANRLAWTRVRVNGGEQVSAFAASLGPSDPTRLVADPRLPAPIPVPVASPSVPPRRGAFP